MRNIGDMNDLCNFQDVIMLCEIFEGGATLMLEKYGFNSRRCNSASTLSGCIQWNISKVIIALPTFPEIVELFKKKLIGGFSCVSTKFGFKIKTLLPVKQ